MPAEDVVEVVTAVGDALDYAHQRKLLHRDVKPANILLTSKQNSKRRIMLTDFGIARRADEVNGLTSTNITVGSMSYTAPEQLMGQPLDGRADQYSLAATAYRLFTGAPPFVHSNPAVVISHHLNSPPPKLADTRPELAGFDSVMAKALSKDPKDRYATSSRLRPRAGRGSHRDHHRPAHRDSRPRAGGTDETADHPEDA